MKKFLYFFLIIAITLSSCGGNNEIPVLPPDDEMTEETILGIWEVYYSEKQITGDPYGKPIKYPGFRDPSYDGFKTRFYKEGNEYKFNSTNVIGNIIDYGTYSVERDPANPKTFFINFRRANQNENETIFGTSWKETSFDKNGGIMTLYFSYEYISDDKKNKYFVTDSRGIRNINIAPDAHPKVNKVDLSDYSKLLGIWEIYDLKSYINGVPQTDIDKAELDSIKGNTYTFGYDKANKKICTVKTKAFDKATNQWIYYVSPNAPVFIVDDIIHIITKARDKDGNIVDWPIYLWVKDWAKRTDPVNGTTYEATFVDFDEYRNQYNLNNLLKVEKFLKKNE